jgi:hypothetical protein
MRMLRRLAVAVAVATLVFTSGTANAASPPYSDPSVTGGVALCDNKGQAVISGSVYDKPFVWRAVSSTPAPSPYNGKGAKATLLAYQPRPGTPADQWSGDILTATSSYTNSAYPMAAATGRDFTLKDFLDEFPATVDGYIQLRMYFGASGAGTNNASYPATNVKITGDTWTAVNAPNVPCDKGTAKSSETVTDRPQSHRGVVSSGASGHAMPGKTAAAPSNSSSSAAAKGAVGSTSAAATGATTGSSNAAQPAGSKSPAVALGLVGAGVASLGGLFWWRRSRVSR